MNTCNNVCGRNVKPPNRDGVSAELETKHTEKKEQTLKKFLAFQVRLRELAEQLKRCCNEKNEKGIQQDLTDSAKTIHEIALEHFKMSPDKISLIKCIGLLNSALVRKPNNASDIEKDLYDKCRHILQQANAKDQTADLSTKAKLVKSQIDFMRKSTTEGLETMKELQRLPKTSAINLTDQQTHKINFVKTIQEKIAAQYKEIMKDISRYCEDVMGLPPCKFAIVEMGSLARNEITPYSDFEHIILLEKQKNYEKHLEYFRWFSVIFHTIILNLQETIVPGLNIMYLNDKNVEMGDWFFDTHTSGVSFDGMMPQACKFPLGKQTNESSTTTELIKPVDKMLEYLSCKNSFKKDYHLSEILMQTCFVYGDESLHKKFESGIEKHRESKSETEKLNEIQHQVKEDFKAFANRIKLSNMRNNGTFNVKQLFYRTSTLMITALGKIFGIESSTCFDIINKLAKKDKISDNAKHKLSYAVAIACEVRLRVYMKAESQKDYLQSIDNILQLIDKESLVSYFQITYCLHRKIIKLLEVKITHFYKDASLFNLTILYALRLDELMLSLLIKYIDNTIRALQQRLLPFKQNVSNKEFCDSFEKSLEVLENEIDFEATLPSPEKLLKLFRNLCDLAQNLLLKKKKLSDAVDILQCVLEVCQRLTRKGHKLVQDKETDENSFLVAFVAILVDSYTTKLKETEKEKENKKIEEATIYINQTFDMVLCNNPIYTFLFYLLAGNNWFKMEQYVESLNCLQIALGIRLSTNAELEFYDHRKNYLIAMMYSGIGACLLKLAEYEESLVYLDIAKHMIEMNRLEESHLSIFAFSPAVAHLNFEMCLQKL